jgi:6-phosphofructokinase 1
LERTIRERTGLDAKMVILGYIQRGGSPTARDRMIASLLYEAVNLLSNGSCNKAVGIHEGSVVSFDLAEAMRMKNTTILEMSTLAEILSQ